MVLPATAGEPDAAADFLHESAAGERLVIVGGHDGIVPR
jgi:hypothetical protein